MPRLTVADQLVIAASRLQEEREGAFTAEELVIAAWRAYPRTFGLAGPVDEESDPLYPDSNRVFAEIMGTKPIRRQGWLEKVGEKRYQVTDAGRRRALSLTGQSPTRKAGLERRELDELGRLLGSRALEKYRDGRESDLTFHDASVLWGITARTNAMEFNTRLSKFRTLLETVEERTDDAFVLTQGGKTYTRADIEMLRAVSDHLMAQFETEINTIKRRTTDR